MLAEELINQMIPPLKLDDRAHKAVQWMEELRVNQLPVIDNQEYIGLVSEDQIYAFNDENALISDLELICKDVYVPSDQHFYDILRIAGNHSIQVIAVLGEELSFLGVVTLNDTLLALAESTAMQESGGILVLLVDNRDYSLSEISRLVEENDAKIMSTHITRDKQDPAKLQVTLKINKTDLNRIVATFERFSYRILARFQSAENLDLDKERLDQLFRYLNV